MVASREEQLARILDECEHGSTAAFCPVCKRHDRTAENVARQRRKADRQAWETEDTTPLPYPRTQAAFPSTCECGDQIEPQDWIYKIDGVWCCEPCAHLARVIGGNGG